MDENLIYDIGANDGADTAFYLAKGFRVISVEANPKLAELAKHRFSDQIATGQLTLIGAGVWDSEQTLTFYNNLDNDHWSSFDPEYGCRNGTRFETSEIPCFRIGRFLAEYGIPYYMKIDVEGADKRMLADLQSWTGELPEFISVEEFRAPCIDAMSALGYSQFQIVPQANKKQVPPKPPLEGTYTEWSFDGRCSGLFGLELPGAWINADAAKAELDAAVAQTLEAGPPYDWFDVHARRQAGKIPAFIRSV